MKKLILVLVLGLILSVTANASAAVVTVTAAGTGDNWLWAWNGSSWVQGTNFSVWQNPDSLPFNVEYGQPLDLYFAVMNETRGDTNANPAGFLGQLTLPSGAFYETGTNKLLTSAALWDVAMVPYETWVMPSNTTPLENTATTAPIFNPTATNTGLVWVPASQYGDNSNDPNVWGDIPTIDGSAQWLWTKQQFNHGANGVYDGVSGQTYMDQLAVFHVRATATPEPASMVLLGMGLVGLVGRKLRSKFIA